MTLPKVLVATPHKGGLTAPYVLGVLSLLNQEEPDAEYIPSMMAATYVNVARNDFVREARRHGCEEIIFVDSDVGLHAAHIRQLRSHPVDVVGGIYAKRVVGESQFPVHATGEPPTGTLLPVNDLPTGLMRIKMPVFDKLDRAFPHRRYRHGTEEPRTEYFPLGLCMPGSHEHPAEAKLERIRAILRASAENGGDGTVFKEIVAVMQPESPGKEVLPELVGEDCGFCRMCRAAGIPLYVDLSVRVRHYGEAGFPLQELPL